ncbi:proline-rich protein 15 isoform X2 [Ambystoma mexicanum]
MADSATAKGGNPGWWKALTVRKKPKDMAVYGSGVSLEQPDPSAERTFSGTAGAGTVGTIATAASSSPRSRENHPPKGPPCQSGEAQADKLFSEKTGRRNLKISRSGRFKEKRKVRVGLPESPKFFEGNASGEDRQ